MISKKSIVNKATDLLEDTITVQSKFVDGQKRALGTTESVTKKCGTPQFKAIDA